MSTTKRELKITPTGLGPRLMTLLTALTNVSPTKALWMVRSMNRTPRVLKTIKVRRGGREGMARDDANRR
jgi:hypothetical protein